MVIYLLRRLPVGRGRLFTDWLAKSILRFLLRFPRRCRQHAAVRADCRGGCGRQSCWLRGHVQRRPKSGSRESPQAAADRWVCRWPADSVLAGLDAMEGFFDFEERLLFGRGDAEREILVEGIGARVGDMITEDAVLRLAALLDQLPALTDQMFAQADELAKVRTPLDRNLLRRSFAQDSSGSRPWFRFAGPRPRRFA